MNRRKSRRTEGNEKKEETEINKTKGYKTDEEGRKEGSQG